jgi:hypothetical protein
LPTPLILWKISPACGVLADRRRRAVGVIGAGHVWPIASAWVDGIAAGLEKNWLRMHDMIDRRVRAFLQGLACSQTGVQGGRPSCAMQNGVLLSICWLLIASPWVGSG